MKLFKEFSFEAAHKLPLVDKNHKCFNLHGHSFNVKITIKGPVNELGRVMDLSDIKNFCKPIIEELDHKYLNEIDGLDNPTSENIAVWIWQRLIQKLPELSSIEIMETCNSGCEYRG